MSIYKNLNKTDKRTRYCVHGWIKETEIALNLRHIPLGITSMVIIYCRKFEKIIIHSNEWRHQNNQHQSAILNDIDSIYPNVVGSNSVLSSGGTTKQVEWKLKILHLSHFAHIGITSIKKPTNKQPIAKFSGCNYLMGSNGVVVQRENRKSKFTPGDNTQFKTGDIVTINVNLTTNKIKWTINDNNTAAMNIWTGKTISYRLFIAAFDNNDSIQICDYLEWN